MSDNDDLTQGQRLLAAVERILADTPSLIAYAEECDRRSSALGGGDDLARDRAAKEIIGHYSTRTAVSGGVSALPGIIPGIGTAVAIAGGAVADVTFILKFEIEMAIVLCQLHGHDVRVDSERYKAFLLACVSTLDAKSGGDFLSDFGAKANSIWDTSQNDIKRLLLTVLTRLTVSSAAKGIFRAIPFVGIAVSSTANKVLTTKVGERCVRELRRRPTTAPTTSKPAAEDDDVVDAHIRS